MKATRARIEGDPVLKAKLDDAKRAAWADPEVRRRKAEAVRAQWADPELKAAMLAKRAATPHRPRKPRVLKPRPPVSAAGRANMGAAVKAAWADPIKRAAMLEGRRRAAAAKPKAVKVAKVRTPRPPVVKRMKVARAQQRRPAVLRPMRPPKPASAPVSADVIRWAGWFLAAGWRVGETAALFGLTADRLGDALDRPDKLERSAA